MTESSVDRSGELEAPHRGARGVECHPPMASEKWTRFRSLRDGFGASIFYGLALFPSSLVLWPLIGPVWRLSWKLRDRSRSLAWACALPLYALAAFSTFTLGRLGPFLDPSDWAWSLTAGALAAIHSIRRPGREKPSVLRAIGFAAPLACFPPMPPAWPTRLGIGCAGFVSFLLFESLSGRAVRVRASPVSWGFAALVPSVAARALLFWLLPTADPAPILAALPGSSVVMPAWPNPRLSHRFALPINGHDMRVAMAGCEAPDRIVGTLDTLYVRRGGEGGAWSTVDYPPGDQLALDCEHRMLWVPEMVQERLWGIDLDTLAVEKPFEHCGFAGPTVVGFDLERTTLFGFPGGEHLGRYEPGTGACEIAVEGGTIVAFSVSSSRGEALIVRNGRIERCDLHGSDRCDPVLRMYDPRLPATLQTDRWNKSIFVVHFNKIVEDPKNNQVFATSLQSGRLYRLDRESLLETGEVFLEPGIRWLQLDPARRRVYVGGFVRGHLFVVDADTLEVEARLFLGRKIRYFEPIPGDRLLAATSVGALDIDVAQALVEVRVKH